MTEKIKRGDRAAFNELYEQHFFSLCAYAELFLSPGEAEDVVQDVFLNVWLRREGLDKSLSIRGYLLRSVYNASLNVIKRNNHLYAYNSTSRKEIEEMGYLHYDPDANEVIRRLYNQDLRDEIDKAIDSLPPKCRNVFLLSYIQNIPSKEISRQLNISVSTVENHIYSALKQLRKKLEAYKIIGLSIVVIVLIIIIKNTGVFFSTIV